EDASLEDMLGGEDASLEGVSGGEDNSSEDDSSKEETGNALDDLSGGEDAGIDTDNLLGDVDDILSLLGDDSATEDASQKNSDNAGAASANDADTASGDSIDLSSMLSDDNVTELDDISDIFALDDLSGDTPADDNASADDGIPDLDADVVDLEVTGKDEGAQGEDGEGADKLVPKKRVGFFARLFGNVIDDKYIKAVKAEEEAERKKQEAKEKQEVDEDGNPIPKGKGKKKSKKDSPEAQAEKAEKEAKKKEKQAKARAVKEAKKKKKEEKKAESLIDEDVGRINRLGAAIVFLFFGIVAFVTITGTDSFSYSQSIRRATDYFGARKYNNAYNEVRGVDIKEDDQEIYDKIMTVMFVNKQLNSYNNYYSMEMYPEALDSLLKGLKRYDEYITLAKELGITSDLDYVRGQITGELDTIYEISEDDAYKILDVLDQEEYSKEVIEAAKKVEQP
nr:hypothetical protein [Lachnospiraceae bacterium]